MPVQMPCSHCNKLQSPYLNPKTNEVYCGNTDCEKIIKNVNHFIKTQLQTLKQYKESKKIAFRVKCNNCGKEDKPIDTGTDIICMFCKKSLDQLTDTFKMMLKAYLSKSNKDI